MAANGDSDNREIMLEHEPGYPDVKGGGLLQRLTTLHNSVDSTREPADAWVMTYMDLITLLLTLFILLLAYESKSSGEYEEVTRALAEASKGTGGSVIAPEKLPMKFPEADTALEEMSRELRQQLDQAGLGGSVGMQLTAEQLDIQLNEKILFPSGEARFSSKAFQALDPIARLLAEQGYEITVEGHTDNIPISNARFPSNWELSVARAAYVVRYLIDQGIASKRLKAVGYADTRPLAGNQSAEGRRTNRRVTLVIHQQGSAATSNGELP
jgi:chemotaxis protein MotB